MWLSPTGLACEYCYPIIESSRLTEFSGCSYSGGGYSSFVWRFPVAFQIIPLIFLFIIVWFFPESPRWLVKVGREDEARYILGRLRGETGNHALAEAEFQDIRNVAEMEKKSGKLNSYFHMLWDVMPKAIGGGSSGQLHIGRRVQLVVWLQILQEWIGIAGVTICEWLSTAFVVSVRAILITSRRERYLQPGRLLGSKGSLDLWC